MATETWTGAISANWRTSGNWTPQHVPGKSDLALIGSGFTITEYTAETSGAGVEVGGISLGASSTLELGNPADGIDTVFTIEGAEPTTIAGMIDLNDGSTLALKGNIEDDGVIAVNGTSSADSTSITIAGAVTLAGSGGVTLSETNGGTAAISGGGKLTNDVTIAGSGAIGVTLTNNGTIDADGGPGAGPLVVGFASMTNNGVLEATSPDSTLEIENETVGNKNGVIEGLDGSAVSIVSSTVTGGTLDGEINVGGLSNLFDGVAINPTGTVSVQDGAVLALEGTIDNQGLIQLLGSGDPTELVISANTRLTGGGDLQLTNESDDTVLSNGTAVTLTNTDGTISGAGEFGNGDGTLSLVNAAKGVIDDNGGFMILQLNSALANQGLVEEINGFMFSDVGLANTGTIDANGGQFIINSTTDIGGKIDISNGGAFVLGAGTMSAAVKFTSNNDLLQLDNGGDFTGTVAGLQTGHKPGNALDLLAAAFDGGSVAASFTQNGASGVLTVGSSFNTYTITLEGQYADTFTTSPPPTGYTGFVLADDGQAGYDGTRVTYVNDDTAGPAALDDPSGLTVAGMVAQPCDSGQGVVESIAYGQAIAAEAPGAIVGAGVASAGDPAPSPPPPLLAVSHP